MITGYQSGAQIVLEPNPYWAGPKPGFKHIVIKLIDNTAALQANLLSGDVDMVNGEGVGLTIDQVIAMQKQHPDQFNYIFKPSLTYEHIDLQKNNPILADLRVRKALLMAIDRETMVQKLFEGKQPVATTWVNPLEVNHSNDGPTYTYDPAKAKALLAEAGWKPGSDGICRNAAGEALSIELSTTAGNRLRELQEQVLQSQWKAACVQIIIKNEPARTLFGETLKHRVYPGMVMYAWSSAVGESPKRTLGTSDIPTKENNYTGTNQVAFSDPRMDDDIAKAETELNPAKQKTSLGRHAADLRRTVACPAAVLSRRGARRAQVVARVYCHRPWREFAVGRELAPGLSYATRAAEPAPILVVRGLTVTFPVRDGDREVVAGIGYDLYPGRTLGVVGEFGCGKTITALALMGLVPPPGNVVGSIRFEGRELMDQPVAAWRALRGDRMAMVFQEPMTALNPVMPVGRQIAEVLVLHKELGWRTAGARAVELLDAVGIPSARERATSYPHQLSGGQRQRAMIAMALACRPALLIADEPTTALDVTIQAQILDLMADLQSEIGMAIQFISHNLAVISEIAHDIIVMYAGRIVERAPVEALFASPLHPYTHGLIATLPDPIRRVERLPVIPGGVADFLGEQGCSFANRCSRAKAACRAAQPVLEELAPGHFVACIDPGQ